ncbi:MAG: type II toxin-antitoxin system PemK/MazF family toxin [Bacteroidota bacterium]
MTRKYRSNIWFANIYGQRVPVIIISADHFNQFDDHFQIIPISTRITKRHRNDEVVPWRGRSLQVNRIMTVHEQQLIDYDSNMDAPEMEALKAALKRRFDL